MRILVEFKVSIVVESEDGDELSQEQYVEMDELTSELEDVVNRRGCDLNEAVWEEVR